MAYYAVLKNKNKTNQVGVFKATDPTSSWSYVAGVAVSSNIRTVWVDQVGTDLHIAMQNEDMVPCYCKFDTTLDSFTITKEEVSTDTSTALASIIGVSISVRSDGDVIVLYSGLVSGGAPYPKYSRRESGSWTKDVQLATATTKNAGVIVKGASDRMHFFYGKTADDDLFHRSLDSSNTLDTEATVDSTAAASPVWLPVKSVAFESGGQTKVRVPYADTSSDISIAEFDSGANPSFVIDTGIGGVDVVNDSGYPRMCAAVDGTDVYVVFAESSSADIYYTNNIGDTTYAAAVELHDAVTCNAISANIYDRSGKKLAYLWDNNGTVEYDELDIAPVVSDFTGWGMPI